MLNVYFYEAFAEEAESLRRHLPSTINAGFTWKTIQETNDIIPSSPLISIRTQSRVPHKWKLDGIVSRTTGYDHLVGLKTPCGHLPLYCNRAVAEQAMLLWMALLRKLPEQTAHFATFNRDHLTGRECAGKNLLVVGVGHIGSELVKIGRGLGMNVRGVDIIASRSDVTIAKGLPWADIIVCSMNLTKKNAGYFSYERLKKARPGVIFVNIARGELSPTAGLVRLLDSGHLAGVALDVFEDEDRFAVSLRAGMGTYPLAGRSNVICTPHNAFNTQEAVERKSEQTARQVVQFLKDGTFLWPVPR